MVDRQKIETNIAHNFFCSLALTDVNNYLIFTVADEKNWTGLLLQRCWKISHAVYRLHNATAYQMSLRYRYRGENGGLAALFATIISQKYQEKEKYAVIMHSHFSEFNHNAGTAMSRYIINSTCVTTKLRQYFKVLSAFLCSFAINDNDVSAGKSNRKCYSIYLSRYSLRFGKLRRGNRFLK